MKSKARLIAAGGGGQSALAGIQIRLTPRTVTYWRTPGDAGTPPVVSFEGSENLGKATFAFPAPRRINEDGIEALGYLDEVIFPLRVQPADPSRPVALHVKLDYAACEKICIPMHAEAELTLPTGAAGPFAADLAAAEAAVPVRGALGDKAPVSIVAVRAIAGDWAAGKGRFVVNVRAPGDAGAVALFAEGPAGWYLQPAPAERRADGSLDIGVAIVQAPRGAVLAQARFALTLVAGKRAIEVPVHLDSKSGAF